jgi:glutamine amidotransferase
MKASTPWQWLMSFTIESCPFPISVTVRKPQAFTYAPIEREVRSTVTRVVLVDYGASNLLSALRAFRHIGVEPTVATRPEDVMVADFLVLPGVGAFGKASEALRATGLDNAIREHVRSGRPFLGICLGMQLMFEESEEFGRHEGLRLLPGRVVPIPKAGVDGRPHKIPHIGWSKLRPASTQGWNKTLLDGFNDVPMYFVHSFMAEPANHADRLAEVDYDGRSICAAVSHDNMVGFQPHPEKSGTTGIRILRDFLRGRA